MNSFVFKVATESDVDAVAAISKRTFYDTFKADNSGEDMDLFLEQNFNETAIKDEVSDAKNQFLLLYQSNELCGYAKLSESENPVELEGINSIEISRLYIEKHIIGKGVGAALMQRIIELARERNKEIIWLGVWEQNQRAINFYKKWGFEKFGEHVFMLGNDIQNDWLMKKML